ncbi:methyltransferase-like protein 24 [Amphibalanus amphitrite]|uniref:methyltransferase-like protein 24 n=1 Tax=Amphibalanus amphitrite TaxID=1232801 RepID=UPI001C900711|nr:methyltransferase-like protein 24 [Amphibalanus amphitrite]
MRVSSISRSAALWSWSSVPFNQQPAVELGPSATAGTLHATGSFSPAVDSEEEAVFRKLDELLTAVDTEARASCLHLYGAGGRCFHCARSRQNDSDRSVVYALDGRKPVCLNLLPANCSVLSFGVNHDFSFEETMEDLGCMVHAFDPTMGVSSFRKSRNIHFHSLGIGSSDAELGGFPVASLGTIVRRARVRPGTIHYLKLDVETSEWEALHQQLTTGGDLLRVQQLNVEFHLLQWSPTIAEGEGMKVPRRNEVSRENAVRFIAVVEALQAAGFGLVSSDPNLVCQDFEDGCLSFLYDTHWVNKKISANRS